MRLTRALTSYLTAILLILGGMLLVPSCSSSKQSTTTVSRRDHQRGSGRHDKRQDEALEIRLDAATSEQCRKLLAEGRKWMGVPYKWGGNDRDGVDCSGLVVALYRDALSIKLPRTSRQQSAWCRQVDTDAIVPGDLLFFDTSRDRNGVVSHVGLYIGDGRMLHSSSSKGVIVCSIRDNYYSSRLLSGGRVTDLRDDVKSGGRDIHKDAAPLLATAKGTEPKPEKQAEKPKKNKKAKKQAPTKRAVAPKPEPARQATVAAVAPANGPKLNPDDARALVLGSLIEEKIDSIFAEAHPAR